MELTPRDIQDKQFHDSFRGYSHEEVDAFLDEVAQAFEKMYQDYAMLERRVVELEERPAESRVAEEMLRKTIYSAQRTATEAVEEAQAAAARLVADAEEKARDLAGVAEASAREAMAAAQTHARDAVAAADKRAAAIIARAQVGERELEARISALRTFEHEYRARLAALLEEQLTALADVSVAPPEVPPVSQLSPLPPLPALPPLVAEPELVLRHGIHVAPEDSPEPEGPGGDDGMEDQLDAEEPQRIEVSLDDPPEVVREEAPPRREDRRPRPSAHLERAEAEPRTVRSPGRGPDQGGDTVVMTWPNDVPPPGYGSAQRLQDSADSAPESGVLRVITGPARVRPMPAPPATRPEPPGPPQGPTRRQDTRPSARGDGLDEEEHQSITRLFWGGEE